MTERSETLTDTEPETEATAPESPATADSSPRPDDAPVPPPMFMNRYFIGAVAAFIIFVIISFSGLKPSSEVIVKTLGVVITLAAAAWFMIKPWK